MILHLLVTIMLITGLVWKAVDLARAPRDRLLRLLVAALFLLTAGDLLGFPEIADALSAATADGVGKVAFNWIYMCGLGALVLFFTAATGAPEVYRRHRRLHTALLAAVLVGLIMTMLATPPELRGHSLSTPHMAQPAITAFYLIGNGYFVYAYITSGLWALRYTRMASRHLAPSLRAMAGGLFGLAATSAGRVVWVALRIDSPGPCLFYETVVRTLTDVALGAVLVGIFLSGAVQLLTHLRSVIRHRRMYYQLTPLWTTLATAYPELVLNPGPTAPRREGLRLRHMHAHFYRRLIECRDGLVRLSPYLARVAPDTDLARCRPDQLARHIIAALELKPVVEDPGTALPAVFVASPSGSDMNAEARELLAISAAFATLSEQSRDQTAGYL
ncbi:MAB_1171c family putative transporter [Streptomyces uncialis]|uniref:MAB_1171c family putative transporter n=1 Tax=Streptomyces uncialis TaxID=1048205 RepID=UPI0037FF6F1D